MKPIKLILTAFGPYKDAEVIDFTQLGQHRIFVISGNTGAGKTTIFDAICYALYGTASGEDRAEFRTLRSHFADEDIHTSVELKFSVKGKTYRVFRQMKHRKGNNKSETGDKIEFYECLADGKEIPAVDRFVVQDINQKLVQIIGLTKDQFSQIVMLPQGEFRKLLTSSTDNKEEILRKIFRTEKYEHLEQLVGQTYKQKLEQIKDQLAEQQALIAQVKELVGEPKSDNLKAVFLQPDFNTSQLLVGLEFEQQHLNELSLTMLQQKNEKQVELSALRATLIETEQLNEKIIRLEQLKKQLAHLNEAINEYETWKLNLDYAKQAVEIAWVETTMQEAEQRQLKGQAQLTQYKTSLMRLQEAAEQAKQSFEAEKKKEGQRKQLELSIYQLEQLLPLVHEYKKLEKEVVQDQLTIEQQHNKLQLEQVKVTELKEQIKQSRRTLDQNEQAKVALVQLAQGKEETLRQGKMVSKIIEQYNQMVKYEAEKKEAKIQLDLLQVQYNKLEQGWINAQAAILASHLHQGESCPVCGAVEHPEPAQLTSEAPSKNELDEAKLQLDKQLQLTLALQAQFSSAAEQLKGYKDDVSDDTVSKQLANLENFVHQLDHTLTFFQQRLRQEWKEQQIEFEKLEQSNQLYETIKQRLGQEEQQLEVSELNLQQSSQDLDRRRLKHTAEQVKLQQITERIPSSISSIDKLEEQYMTEKQQLVQLIKRYEQAEMGLVDVEKQLSAALNAVQTGEQAIIELSKLFNEAKQRFAAKLEQSKFDSYELYTSFKLDEEQLNSLKQRIERYEHELLTLKHEQQLLEQAIGSRLFTNTEQLKLDITQNEQLFEQILKQEAHISQLIMQIATLMKKLDTLSSQISTFEQEVAMIHDLFLTIKGDNRLKLSYERYVLIDYLEQIIEMANLRLKRLTGGQFELKRSDRLEVNGKQSGLGLDVYDSYTGQNRDVKSLSGGEKFNASLCLALGMTDVIQASQGGVSIEMMFIDEGFGSLDEESLQKAIATLIDLQKAGRMIGVISHVQELKDALDACLEVSKTRDGYAKTNFIIKR